MAKPNPQANKTVTKPCDWCDRETQLTCPECDGTGLVEAQS